MLFSSIIFLWFFLPATLILYRVVPKSLKNWVLLFASLFFYAFGEPVYVLLMMFSIAMNWGFGLLINHFAAKDASFWKNPRKLALAGGVVCNLLLLGYFKYAGFFVGALAGITGWNIAVPAIVLPIGISFYTFQAMSYIIDLYRQEISVQKSPFKLGLYISLFPQLIAGPIVQYGDIANQIDSRVVTSADLAYGVRRFVYGLSKKVILSNSFAAVADPIFNAGGGMVSTPAAWLGLLCYTLQIYYDFSGYSDMAIGLGRMFGFNFLENFNYPYISSSIREFWRRWHISLSSWFRSYLYIPLGGNRKGEKRTLFNLLVVFFCTGLWHGASAQFIAWGLYFGLFLIAERLFLGKWLQRCPKIISHIYAVLVVMVSWAIFRGNGLLGGLQFIGTMFGASHVPAFTAMQFLTPRLAVLLVAGIALAGPLQAALPKFKSLLYQQDNAPLWETVLLLLLLVSCFILLVAGSYNPFIYFRF